MTVGLGNVAPPESATRPTVAGACPLIVNANAGALHGTAGPEELTRLAAEAGLPVEIIATESVDAMRETLRRLDRENAPRVAVSGGDGTVGLAAQELAHSKVALGIVPQGTANNFAHSLGLPVDPVEALRVIAAGHARDIDLGRVGDRFFIESAGVGLFADMLRENSGATDKNLIRILAAVLKVLVRARARGLRLIVDGQVHAERALLCEVANTYRIATALPIAPEAKLADGLLNVVVIGDVPRRELPRYLSALLNRAHRDLPGVTTLRAREVCIESRRPMAVHADDQVIGNTPTAIQVVPGALRVLVPQQAGEPDRR